MSLIISVSTYMCFAFINYCSRVSICLNTCSQSVVYKPMCALYSLFQGSYIFQYVFSVMKYGSTSHVGIGQVQNGILYIRYKSRSKITTAE